MADCSVFVLWDAERNLALMENRPDLGPDEKQEYWIYPGGKLEPGEDPMTAAARECYEECGVTVAEGDIFELRGERLFGKYNRYSPDQSDWNTYAFVITSWCGTPRRTPVEHVYSDFEWRDPGEFMGPPDGHTCVKQIAARLVACMMWSEYSRRQIANRPCVYVVRPNGTDKGYIQSAKSPAEAVAFAITKDNAERVDTYRVVDWDANIADVSLNDVDAIFAKYTAAAPA